MRKFQCLLSLLKQSYIYYHRTLKFLLLATSVTPERSISRMTFIKSFPRKITTGNRLNLISTPSTSQKLQPGNNLQNYELPEISEKRAIFIMVNVITASTARWL